MYDGGEIQDGGFWIFTCFHQAQYAHGQYYVTYVTLFCTLDQKYAFFQCLSCFYEPSQIFLKFKTFGIKFGHLEQKLEFSNQNMCRKSLKNNAHVKVDICNVCHYFLWNFPEKKLLSIELKLRSFDALYFLVSTQLA
jgi:hypothetical protein